MATLWIPAPESGRTQPQVWLLKDGSTLTHPKLEQSASGRRVRFVGTTASVGVNQVATLIDTYMTQEAKKRGSEPLMLISSDETAYMLASTGTDLDPVKFHLINTDEPSYRERGTTSATWTFRHPTLGLAAVIQVEMASQWNRTVVQTLMYYRSTNPADGKSFNNIHLRSDQKFNMVWGATSRYSAEGQAMDTWLTQHNQDPEALQNEVKWGSAVYNNGKRAALDFLTRCRAVNDLASIYIPDFRDPLTPQWMEMSFQSTNYDGELDRQISDYLITAPLVEKLQAATKDVLDTLRQIGIVVDGMPEKAYTQAMSGDLTEFVAILRPDTEHDKEDPHHKVALNLATGTIAVACMHGQGRKDEVAQAYENAKFMAQLKGEEDEFLAYARKYVESKAEESVRKIVDDRQALQKDLEQAVLDSTSNNGGN